MHSTASSETAGAAMAMTGMGTGVVGIPMTTPTTAMGMEVAGTTVTTITEVPPMVGMGTARDRIMATRIGMGADPTLAMAPILIRIMVVAHILIPTLWVLAPFFPHFWALSSLAIKAGAGASTL
jgi:hypothetical protein